MSHYSATGYKLTKPEFDYLKPAIPKLVNDMDGRFYLTCDLDDLGDSLNRLKGMYDNWNEDEIPREIVKDCYRSASINPFREFMKTSQNESKLKEFLKPLIKEILREGSFLQSARFKKGANFITKLNGYSIYYKDRYATIDADRFVGVKNDKQIQVSDNLVDIIRDCLEGKPLAVKFRNKIESLVKEFDPHSNADVDSLFE